MENTFARRAARAAPVLAVVLAAVAPVIAAPSSVGASAATRAVAQSAGSQSAVSPEPATIALRFIGHGAFFSRETETDPPIDPQVFVAAPGVPAGVGAQEISHVAGLRPALLADDPATPLENAQGDGLGFTLGVWLAARGTAQLTPLADGGERIAIRFSKLIPFGVYSVFENHFSADGVSFTPLDGDGSHNTFTADESGDATLSIVAPDRLTHANAVLLVYHSDGQAHGIERGTIGVTAHHQLIARLP